MHTNARHTAVETADFLLARGPFTILDDSEDAAVRALHACASVDSVRPERSPSPSHPSMTHKKVQRFGPGRILHESPEFAALADRAIAR